MITVWKDGTWKDWGKLDAEYAASDPDWLVNVDTTPAPAPRDEVRAVVEAAREALVEFDKATMFDANGSKFDALREALAALTAQE